MAAVVSAEVVDLERLRTDSSQQASRSVAQLREAFEALAGKHGGTLADAAGDVFRATFTSATDAVSAAVALQDSLDERNKGLGEGDQVDVRASVAMG
ncbi:MAG: hypothetical protein FJX64_04255 [Alphaproteobacteria bacterium]|nr:hypothetical protein [Alphaproteobacteria bacterium]